MLTSMQNSVQLQSEDAEAVNTSSILAFYKKMKAYSYSYIQI